MEMPLLRERISKIYLILLVYKDGVMEDGSFINAYRITKLLYGKDNLMPIVVTELKKLDKHGLIYREEIIIKNRITYTIKPNIDKFVDLLVEYFNLDFSEEEKQIFKEWFKSIEWKKLLVNDENDWENCETIGNIFEYIGLCLKCLLITYNINKEDTLKTLDIPRLPDKIMQKLLSIKLKKLKLFEILLFLSIVLTTGVTTLYIAKHSQ